LPKLWLTARANEQFRALGAAAQASIDDVPLRLRADPEGVGIELRGRLKGTWRARVGGYRILYRIRKDGIVV
jgi:mRNA-degrading endonuclease RelE of RelBE toxin-antitoxin system